MPSSMTPLPFSLLLLLPLFFSIFITHSHSRSDTDYEKWILHNVDEYRKKGGDPREEAGASSTLVVSEGVRRGGLDPNLMKAEEEKVRVRVSQDGSGEFSTIREAIDSIPKKNTRRVVLEIKPGVYREKIVIPRSLPFLTLLGDVTNLPIISGNDTASTAREDGTQLKTFHSATVAIDADYFVAANIRFENTAPYPERGSKGGQAVALRISGNKAAFYNCSFIGTQDTLYDHKGLHYFNNCFIQGSTDFIFGYGTSLYEGCVLKSVARRAAALTAQKRSKGSLWSGFSFTKSVIQGSSGGVYLGRAWGDQSRVVFSYTYMDKIVLPQGWSDWGFPQRRSTVYYGEYECSGPGANATERVKWARLLTEEEARPFLGTYYVDGDKWLLNPLNYVNLTTI